jgi:hypothetical protein
VDGDRRGYGDVARRDCERIAAAPDFLARHRDTEITPQRHRAKTAAEAQGK